jgi:hypothetical protein
MLPRLVPYTGELRSARSALGHLREYVGVEAEVDTGRNAGKVEIELLSSNRERNIR